MDEGPVIGEKIYQPYNKYGQPYNELYSQSSAYNTTTPSLLDLSGTQPLIIGDLDLSFSQKGFQETVDENEKPQYNIDYYSLDNKSYQLAPTLTNNVIVLDLDETCVHSYLPKDFKKYRQLEIHKYPDLRSRTYIIEMNDVVQPRGTGQVTHMWGIRRPHIREFLTFCFSYFKAVIVWSAGQYEYVHAIVDQLFAEIEPPHAVLTWNNCIKIDNHCHKDLSILFRDPELGKYLNPTNTLILDDNKVSFMKDTPQNGILIDAYRPPAKLDRLRADDIALLQLKAWLLTENVMKSNDVRRLDKSMIFRKSMGELLNQ